MKNHTKLVSIIIFFAVLFFLVIPSFFARIPSEGLFSSWDFPWSYLSLGIISILILSFQNNLFPSDKKNFNIHLIWFFIGFISLNITAFLFQIISSLFNEAVEIKICLPTCFSEWLFCILNFSFSAFYEETIFRFYIPECLYYIFEKVNNKKILFLLS